jgi:hypothetical protein
MKSSDLKAIHDFLLNKNMQLFSFRFHDPRSGNEFHVRLNQATIEETIEIYDRIGNPIYSTMSDISLIEVIE